MGLNLTAPTLTMRQVEAFRAVMATGTATEAARILGITQPAVSRMLADLEKGTQLTLFLRQNRQLIPTEEGRILFEEVERAFFGLEQIGLAAESIRSFGRGRLRVITAPGLVSTIVVDLIARFHKLHPGIVTSLEIQPSQHILDWLMGRQYDIGISTLPLYNPGIEMEIVAKGEAVCILPQGDPLAQRKSIRPKDLMNSNCISFRADTMFQYWVDEAFRQDGAQRRGNIEARSIEAVYGFVAAGIGVAVVPPQFPIHSSDMKVAVRPFRPSIEVNLAVLSPKGRPIPDIALEFRRFVSTFLADTRQAQLDAKARPRMLERPHPSGILVSR